MRHHMKLTNSLCTILTWMLISSQCEIQKSSDNHHVYVEYYNQNETTEGWIAMKPNCFWTAPDKQNDLIWQRQWDIKLSELHSADIFGMLLPSRNHFWETTSPKMRAYNPLTVPSPSKNQWQQLPALEFTQERWVHGSKWHWVAGEGRETCS